MDRVGKGIMAGLEEMESDTMIIKVPRNKVVKEVKIKRSFMLSQTEIDMIYDLKNQNRRADLSDIVGKAIKEYYEKHFIKE